VSYVRLPRLFELLRIAHRDGSYPRLMNQLAKTNLLILDDWGLQKIAATQRNDLMKVIEDRYGLRATLVTGQLPIEHWHEYIGEATLADAILDRLLHNAHRLPLKSESLRKHHKDPVDTPPQDA
jgi:DNA replication protein DnaC